VTPSELPATVDTGLVIHSLQKQLEESNRQVSRLMAMVEGLTRQLDERAELAKVPPATVDTGLVIHSLQKQLEESNRQVSRLMAMVEGLTRQLDELLRDRNEEQRAELAKVRAAAAAALTAAKEQAPASVPPIQSDPATPVTADPPSKPNRHPHGKSPIPPSAPRDVRQSRPEKCGSCGSDRVRDRVGPAPIEEYDYVRAHLRVRHTQRYGCACEDCGTVTAPPPPPPMPFDRASCTFALMAWLCFAKCGLFLPLDRLRADFEAQGMRIPSATLTRWWKRGADLLLPVAAAVRASLLCDNHLRMDGTGLLVIFPRLKGEPVKGPERPGETDDRGFLLPQLPVNGQILVFGNDEHAVYVYTPTREGHYLQDFLIVGTDDRGEPIRWQGTVTADALSAYDCLYVGDAACTEGGCNAHALRKFRDEADKAPLLASTALACIDRLFKVEAAARSQGLRGAALLAYRQTHAAPAADEFLTWLDDHIEDLLPSNPVRKAMQYYLNHWIALTLFLRDPEVPIDNNWSENALRKVALLRNNSLFAGGEEGAVRLCTLFTLIGTCRLLGVDPFGYLEWAMTRAVPHPSNRGLVASDLTPAAYKARQQQAAQ